MSLNMVANFTHMGLTLSRMHISETVGWIFSIPSSRKLSRFVVVHPYWPFAHFTHVGLPMGQRTYLSNHWIDLLHYKFYGIVQTCRASSWLIAHLPHMGLPMDQNLSNLVPSVSWPCGIHTSGTVGQISSILSSLQSSKLIVVPHRGHLPIWPYGLTHRPDHIGSFWVLQHLTHFPLVLHICVSESGQHLLR